MMNRNNENSKSKITFSSLMENNKYVFAFSLIVAIICWCVVSIYQTPVVEKTINDVKVNIGLEDSSAQSNGLEVFGKKDYTVSVTVRGLSYIVNSKNFSSENIRVNASCAAVATAGTYDLPLSASIVGAEGDIEVLDISARSVKVKFDERQEKSFALVEDVVELENYSVGAGFIRENPRLSTETLKISGPAKEMAKITALKARIELDSELTKSETYKAEIIAQSSSGEVDLSDFTFDITDPVYITIPIKKFEKVTTAVDFTGIPQSLREQGVKYTINPAEMDISVFLDGNNSNLDENNQMLVGTVDFSQINNIANYIVIKNKNESLAVKSFTVSIDMSSMDKRWLEIPVDSSSANLPEGVSVVNKTIKSVQIIGPAASLKNIDSSAAYAVPVLDGIDLTPGTHTVPAKIMLRTLTDSWAYGSYTVDITVE